MKVRADVAELLRAGQLSQAEIARRLHVAPITVQRTREALGLPAPVPGRKPPRHSTKEAAFWAHTEPVEGGHLKWTGRIENDVPLLRYCGTQESAYRIAFRLHHGREPVGKVRSLCEEPHCVAGSCVADRPMREATRRADAAYEQIFGGPP